MAEYQPGSLKRYEDYINVKPGLRMHLLRASLPGLIHRLSADEMLAIQREIDRLEDMLWRRNMQGIHAEMLKKRDEAIRLYEQNLTDRCVIPFPYGRLRLLYARHKEYRDALRVCQTYLDVTDELARLLHQLPADIGAHRSVYAELVVKLQKRRSRLQPSIMR